MRVEAEALLGLGLGWQGQIAEGMAAYEALLGRVNATEDGPQLERIRMAHGWLRLVRGDVVGAHALAGHDRAGRAAGRVGADRGVVVRPGWPTPVSRWAPGTRRRRTRSGRCRCWTSPGMEWLRPLARFAAVLVPAARGEWAAAEEHAAGGGGAARATTS